MMLEFYNVLEPLARKPHKCFLCGREISSGTRYVRTSCKDGFFFDTCLHKDCKSIIDEYCNNCGENEYTPSDVDEYMREFYCWNICDEEQRESCKEDVFYCPIIRDARLSRIGGSEIWSCQS